MDAEPSIRWYRSFLYVPGHKLDWMRKALGYGADALILDLEDAVPHATKPDARTAIATFLSELPEARPGMFVRVNGWGTGLLLDDLAGIVVPGLDGVALAKTDSPADVRALDRVLTELELSRGLAVGGVEIYPLMETAHGMYTNYESLTASPRVRRAGGVVGAGPGGDYHRAIGNEWTPEGLESLYFSSRAVLEARAAGLENIVSGPSVDLRDEELLRRVMTWARQLGANGGQAIHPAQVPVINEIFSPSAAEIDEARGVLDAFAAAIGRGDAAGTFAGRMIDYAHAQTARSVLRRAADAGVEVGPIPEL